MQLMTKEIEEKLLAQDNPDSEVIIVKYFNPSGAGTWLITDGEKVNGKWYLYGYCHIHEWEWGDVSFNELKELKVPPFGLGVERDLHLPEGMTVQEYKDKFIERQANNGTWFTAQ